MGDLEKNFLQALVGRKKLHAAQCNRKLMGKEREKNILPTRLLEKKIRDDQKSLPGRPLMSAHCLSCPSGFLTLHHGGFVTRE